MNISNHIAKKLAKIIINPDYTKYSEPFRSNGYVHFTDGLKCLLVKDKCVDMELTESDKSLNINFNRLNAISTISKEEIEKFIDSCPKIQVFKYEEEECDECNGTGEVIWEYTSCGTDEYGNDHFEMKEECPICEGRGIIEVKKETGKMVVNEKTAFGFSFGESKFRLDMLITLKDIMNLLRIEKADILQVDKLFVSRLDDDILFIFTQYILDDREKFWDELK